jgi:hypothetical protein
LAIGGGCAWLAGASLLTFLAPLALVPALIPQTTAPRRTLHGLAAMLIICLAIALAWCFILPSPDSDQSGQQHLTSLRWLVGAFAVLAAWAALLWAATAAIIPRPARRRGVLRAAAVTIAAWLWLAFPIWLGPTMAERGWDVPTWLSAMHPLFAMNSAIVELGIWTQHPLAYKLTPFGQDVTYALPPSPWPFVLANLLAAALLAAPRAFLTSRRASTKPPLAPGEGGRAAAG